jgi:Periplasmic copper-binding protein (NosD)
MLRRTTLVTLAVALLVAVAPEAQGKAVVQITSCGQTVTTDAVLTQNLACVHAAGVVIGADGVTVDLKGFTLRGDRSTGLYGIDDNGYDGVTIKNGVIRTFESDVAAYNDADKFSVSDLVISGTPNDGIFVSGASASVKSSTAGGNAYGIVIFGPLALVRTSTASGNTASGVYVNGAAARIQSSTASGNGAHGIRVDGDAPRITGNHTDVNGFVGGFDLNGLGIVVSGYTTAPVGTNVAHGNDDPSECAPTSLC